jgi:hypothetical protein
MTDEKSWPIRWAEEVQILPGGYEVHDVVRGAFAVVYGHDPAAPFPERWAVAAGTTAVLEARLDPVPGEPFTETYSREVLAERRFGQLAAELLGRR